MKKRPFKRLLSSSDHDLATWERDTSQEEDIWDPKRIYGWGRKGERYQIPHLNSLHGNTLFCLCASSAVMRIKASPGFERKRALKILKCFCTLVNQVAWATDRNFNTRLIRNCLKTTYILFLFTMSWFQGIAFAGNWEPVSLEKSFSSGMTSHLSSKDHHSFSRLSPSFILVMNQKQMCSLFLKGK